ncbi:hypothetical protein TA3x_002352 [Tundrisphaera sp. TA3]|uniref:hypothetical protein n=1 Tax=Tundrisphaera sp. TA3 TaxID=3435775 RepID=UPI003EBC16DB
MATDSYEIDAPGPAPDPAPAPRAAPARPAGPPSALPGWFAIAAAAAIGLIHVAAIWLALGKTAGIRSDWPPLMHDHGFQFHHGITAREFLRQTGTTAGYDPSFMGGYAMSVLSGPSTTLTGLGMLCLPGGPALSYKLGVLILGGGAISLVALAAALMGARPAAVAVSALLFLAYFWTGPPIGYAELGMLPYVISVPAGLVAVASLAAYLDRGGFGRWAGACAACSLVFLCHLTSPMLVGPAGLLAYAVAAVRGHRSGRPLPIARHLGLWGMVPVILLVNAFWYLPGFALLETKGPAGIAPFVHTEPFWRRVAEIFWSEGPIDPILLGLGAVGVMTLARRRPVVAAALGGFLLIGFLWGYPAGMFRSLDEFQPGRHTYACFTAGCIASGIGLVEILARLRDPARGRLDVAVAALAVMIGVRVVGPSIDHSARTRLFTPSPVLSNSPHPGALAMVDSIRRHVAPGERLLYEESGLGADPFDGRHYSALLPWLAGVEVIGGPYLHMALKSNFTQFGEGKIFGSKDWSREHFERYARLYRPSAIACWSRDAVRFCRANPDLIRIVDESGPVLIGRVIGFEGATIRGTAAVEARPGRLVVRDAKPGPDGLVVLRYHHTPRLRATPPAVIEPITLEADPVPFIGLRADTPGPITIELVAPPASWFRR